MPERIEVFDGQETIVVHALDEDGVLIETTKIRPFYDSHYEYHLRVYIEGSQRLHIRSDQPFWSDFSSKTINSAFYK
jgi:hypothetical protein